MLTLTFVELLILFPVRIIQCMYHTNLLPKHTVAKRTSERSLENFKKQISSENRGA
jgi:hypothetical protein